MGRYDELKEIKAETRASYKPLGLSVAEIRQAYEVARDLSEGRGTPFNGAHVGCLMLGLLAIIERQTDKMAAIERAVIVVQGDMRNIRKAIDEG